MLLFLIKKILKMSKSLNYIDLFAGAGGLSEGFIRQGFKPIAHVEMNKLACDTIITRVAFHYLKEKSLENVYHQYLKGEITKVEFLKNIPKQLLESVINTEISDKTIPDIFSKIDQQLKNKKVDVIIGGPPCQAYSIVGRARDPKNMADDPRNHLYKQYVKFLREYQPKMFVFENVPGMLSAKNGEYFEKIKNAIKKEGYSFDHKVLNAKDFGVLQDRKRVILIGWKENLNIQYPNFKPLGQNFKILKDLFSDLPPLQNGTGTMGVVNYKKKTTEYLTTTGIRNGIDFTTQHIARPNNENDLEIYRIAVEELQNGRRLNYASLPKRLIKHKNTTSFTNRFQVVNGNGLSHTVVAHIAMDGHYYIHPDINQNRSITVREAARIQSFPDDFHFEGGRTGAFKQIGNAVPPLMAEEIAKKVKEVI
jgi:DNA (cytosine-5)-methyltransferase 1